MATILVIEDEPDICENVVEILELEGFETLFAHNGDMGIELALTHQPDLVLCDIMMPGTDGYQVLIALRDNPGTALMPFVFLTAKADRHSMRHGMTLGADDYITKPFMVADIVDTVTTRLEKQRVLTQRYTQVAADLRSNIFSMLPHELRTPLVSILGYAELLMWDVDTLSPDRISAMAERIFTSGTRLYNLVENFLVYAQIEIIKSDPGRRAELLDFSVNHVDELTTEIARDKAHAANREADLQITVADDRSVRIALESLKKIIEELVDNAFKFSDPGTPVQVTTVVVDNTCQWTICDQGHGMTVEQIANVGAGMQFERRLFEQQGAGLGLVIAQQLVDLYAGTLVINSAPGVQTTVQVTLPLA